MADTYKPNEAITCPHCDAQQDGVAEDFVIPGREDEPCEEECYDCGLHFTVHRNNDTYVVEEV